MAAASSLDAHDIFGRLARRAPVVAVGTIVDGVRKVDLLGDAGPAGDDPLFEIGSVTKTFTALLLAQMCEEGEVTLSDPLARYVPGMAGPSEGRQITLLDLATHTARLRRVPGDLLREALRNRSDPYARYDVRRLEDGLRRVRPRAGLGSKVRYSNFGFAALGHALAVAAEAPYDELVVQRVCEPLGLSTTTTTPSAESAIRYLRGHKRADRPVPAWNLASFAPAGALRSSVADMLTYLQAHLDPEGSALSPAIHAVQQPRVEMRKGRLTIGLAWLILTRKGRRIVWHNGATGGFSAFAGFDPDARVALVALANGRVAGPLTRLGLRALEGLA